MQSPDAAAATTIGVHHGSFGAGTLTLHRLFFQQGFDADPPGFAAEMSSESVGAGEFPAAAPGTTDGEIAAADEFLFTGMEALVSLPVVLARERFAAHGTHKRSFVGVGAEMRSEVVRSREAFGAEATLESGRVFLNAFAADARRRWPGRVCEFEDVVSAVVGDRGRGGAARFVGDAERGRASGRGRGRGRVAGGRVGT